MKKVVIASFTPYLKDVDDAILKKYLENEGIYVEIVSWDNKNYDWKSADAVIIRSTWDYHETLCDYITWLHYLKDNNIKVYNNVDVILNNLYKDKQVKWLKENGIPIMKTEIFSLNDNNMEKPENTLLATIKKYFPEYYGNSMFVLKPTVSARSNNTFLIDPFNINRDSECHVHNDANKLFYSLLEKFSDRGIILQVYAKGIADGEYGLVYLNGVLTQSVVKKPGKLHGNKVKESVKKVPNEIIDLAEKIIKKLPFEEVLIARVDAIMDDNKAKIMELELVEPNIYIRATDGVGLNVFDPNWYLPEVKRLGCHNELLILFAKGIKERLQK